MANSGMFTKTIIANKVTLEVEWSATSNLEANTSTVTVTAYLNTSASLNLSARYNNKFTINGTEYTFTAPASSGRGRFKLGSKTVANIEHNPDGNKSIVISCYYRFNATVSGTSYGAYTATATVDLGQIPRGATITSASNFTDEENPTIEYQNLGVAAVTSLQACISFTGEFADISYRDIPNVSTGTYTFELTEDERYTLRAGTISSNVRTVYFFIKTMIGEQRHLHALEKTFTVVNCSPLISPIVEDINPTTYNLTGNTGTFVKYFSNASVAVNATAQKVSSIVDYSVVCGNKSINTETGVLEAVTSGTFTFSATDSRGNITTETVNKPLVEYAKLTCVIGNNRPDSVGNIDVTCNGIYFNGTFGNYENTLTVQYRYKEAYGDYSNWLPMNYTLNGNTYRATASLNVDYRKSYTFQCCAIDRLMTVDSAERTVTAIPVFDWSETDFNFNVPVNFSAGATGIEVNSGVIDGDLSVSGDASITGDLRLKNSGNAIYFGNDTQCYLKEETDNTLTIQADEINLNGVVNINDNAIPSVEYGEWQPTLSASAISGYITQKGWYHKVGNVVCVGFFVNATCKSGYQTTGIVISGLPFTPAEKAFGGGICYGAYITGGFNFQCWAIGTDSTITPRIQPCNNTSASNITTSASGCCYKNSGGEISLSGTIIYII